MSASLIQEQPNLANSETIKKKQDELQRNFEAIQAEKVKIQSEIKELQTKNSSGADLYAWQQDKADEGKRF